MKILLLVVTLAFVVSMFVRIVEMSIQFDWIDILWTFIFLVCALISGAAYSTKDWEE